MRSPLPWATGRRTDSGHLGGDYALGAIDMGALLRGREGIESITLMTCSGPPDEGDYPLRTVVLAERAN